jgi:hypothetical protein
MSALLTQYFENYAEGSIARMKAAKLAISYYERVKARLLKKEDLSSELPIIKKVGPEGTMTVVKAAIVDYRRQIASAWDMNPKLREVGKYKCSLIVKDREHLPRADMSYQFKSAAGTVRIRISSAGETFKLELDASKNPMSAHLAFVEFEKQLTLIALSSK